MYVFKSFYIFCIINLFLIALFNSNAFGKFLAEINCKNTEKKLEYVCMIYLKDKKTKLKENKAEFTVSADMPSMPGAHIIKPVNSKNLGNGLYKINLSLDMFGEWALSLNFTKPRRDRTIKKLKFGKQTYKIKNNHEMNKEVSKKKKNEILMSNGKEHKHN